MIILGLVLAACGTSTAIKTSTGSDPTTQGATVFQGNFSDPSQQWPTFADTTRSASASDDTYTLQFITPGSLAAAPTISTVQPQDLADVSVAVSAKPIDLHSGDRLGVFCRALQGHSYAFLVGPQSSGQLAWSIQLGQPSGTRQLASGTTTAPSTSSYVVRGDCVGGGKNHRPVILALYVAGRLVGQAKDSKLPAPYLGRPGLSASSATGATRIEFSNFQVRAATSP